MFKILEGEVDDVEATLNQWGADHTVEILGQSSIVKVTSYGSEKIIHITARITKKEKI